jgi:hypothetical protein
MRQILDLRNLLPEGLWVGTFSHTTATPSRPRPHTLSSRQQRVGYRENLHLQCLENLDKSARMLSPLLPNRRHLKPMMITFRSLLYYFEDNQSK